MRVAHVLDRVRVAIECTFVQTLQQTIQLESCDTGGEGSDEDVCSPGILNLRLDGSTYDLQKVIVADANDIDVPNTVINSTVQITRLGDGHSLGFIEALPELAPKNVQQEFTESSHARVMLNLVRVEFDSFVSFVVNHLLGFGLGGVGPIRVTTGFLFAFQPFVDVVSEQTRTTLGLGEVPDLVDGD